MTTIRFLLRPILNLFDGGEGAGGAAEAGGTQAQAPDAGEQAAHIETTSDTLEERRKRYRDMVNSEEFKQFYTEDTQRMIDRRFKETQSLREERDAMAPVVDLLRQRYGIKDGDMDALMAAMDADDGYWEQAADDAGMTVEQYKQYSKMERELAEAREQLARQRGQEQADRQLQKWYTEGEELKQLYPKFDLEAESQNPQFLALLRAGTPIKTAFEVIHMEEIKAGLAQSTAQAAERQITSNIRARGQRPTETGAGGNAAFTVKTDMDKLSKEERADIAKRVLRGERVDL